MEIEVTSVTAVFDDDDYQQLHHHHHYHHHQQQQQQQQPDNVVRVMSVTCAANDGDADVD